MWEGGVHIYGTPEVPNNFHIYIYIIYNVEGTSIE